MSNKLKVQQGLSLVELMVAMVISLFLSAGLFSMFNMSATNVVTTSQFNQLQENGRIALALIERDVSQLGFMADMTGTDFIIGTNTQINALAIPAGSDCVGGGANNASLPNNNPAHFRRLWGYEQGVSADSFACLTGVSASTDVLQIKRLVGPSVAVPNDNNRYYMGATANEAVIFSGDQVTPVMNNARFWEYQHHIYYIQEDSGVPVLRRRVLRNGGMNTSGSYEQLVEGIENIRVLYGFDNDGDDTADSFMPVQNVTNLMWDNELFQRLVALRIFILVRSIDEDRGFTNESSYQLGDKVIAATNDHFRRKVVSATIVLENPVLIRN
ncbi:prepilin-type N-terminal cleavage/methylation domain-containing protein [Shewanella psychrophila]|uniref:Prepilin-type N-terminal cleavage/methylation domain-containing protein n=1 Tax=Shewanella psychrophila TaxID=225848 RepID=A0A1S6HPT2_9GAMM|nr:PilW family protein [Shewanella psychrophila]AQS37535.1 prepilin-type N-terminal cleavage/methylation domain-containing protein [Shewanella psychrophila]